MDSRMQFGLALIILVVLWMINALRKRRLLARDALVEQRLEAYQHRYLRQLLPAQHRLYDPHPLFEGLDQAGQQLLLQRIIDWSDGVGARVTPWLVMYPWGQHYYLVLLYHRKIDHLPFVS